MIVAVPWPNGGHAIDQEDAAHAGHRSILVGKAALGGDARARAREIDLLQDHLHDDVAAFVYERLRRRPMVLPVVVEV